MVIQRVHLLNSYPYLSKKSILKRLERDYEIQSTTRTLERDFKKLAIDFGIDLTYDRTRDGYFIEEQGREQVASLLKFMGLVHLGELFKEGLADFEALQEAVALEDHSQFKGIALIRPLLVALKQRRKISFVHENYSRQTFKKYEISPLQLKEYNNRWYIVGIPAKEKHIKTFGIDRITELKLTHFSSVTKTEYKNQMAKFSQVIGLNYNATEKPVTIELRVSPRQYKYLESLPLHRSQVKIKTDAKKRVYLRLHLIPNYEFKMQLYKMADQVELLAPAWLRHEISETLTQTLKLYTNA